MDHRKPTPSDEPRMALLMERLLTPEEVAVYFRLSYSKVCRYTAQGRIPATYVGGQPRYSLAEVQQALTQAAG